MVEICNFVQDPHPLYALTKKGAAWNWTSECVAAFNELRYKLVNDPVTLAFPDWNDDFYVETDTSGLGVAAVLSQKDQRTGILRPIKYFSSALSDTQKNYSAGQLEAWALVAATRKWITYLRASPKIYLISDHNPLRWMRSQRDPRHTFSRWLMELEELPYQVFIVPGKDNKLPDWLSRAPNLRVDTDVNDEQHFENKVYYTEETDEGAVGV